MIAGGTLVATGALLPWLTVFAGLQTYAGTAGLHGRLLLGGGLVAIVLGAAHAVMVSRSGMGPRLRRAARLTSVTGLALGAAMMGLAGWAMVGLVGLVRARATDPMMLADYGPGLFVALAGTVAVTAAALVQHPSSLGKRRTS